MGLVSEAELKNSIKNNSFAPVYYFYGKNVMAVEAVVKLLISKLVAKGNEIYNLHSFEGKNISLNQLSDSCEALPVFAEYVCCTVCDLNAESLSAEEIKQLTALISDLPQTTVLIFYNTSVDITDGKKYPTPKNKKITDAVSKSGTVCCFSNKIPSELAKDIAAKLNKSGCTITKQNAVYLAELCLCNTMILANELDKLSAYAPGQEITLDIINLVCPRQIEAAAFDIAKAITRLDRKLTMKLLKDLIDLHTEPISILYAVTSNMLDLYRARAAINSGKTAQDVKDDFNCPKNVQFKVDNAFRDVSRMSVAHLRECMKILTETDVAMKSLKTDKQILLEEAMIKMLSYK